MPLRIRLHLYDKITDMNYPDYVYKIEYEEKIVFVTFLFSC